MALARERLDLTLPFLKYNIELGFDGSIPCPTSTCEYTTYSFISIHRRYPAPLQALYPARCPLALGGLVGERAVAADAGDEAPCGDGLAFGSKIPIVRADLVVVMLIYRLGISVSIVVSLLHSPIVLSV